jgi:hypothetical protein
VAILMSLSLNPRESITLFVLFSVQFVVPIIWPGDVPLRLGGWDLSFSSEALRMAIAVIYLVIALAIFWRERHEIRPMIRTFRLAIRDPLALFGGEHEEAPAKTA